MKIILFPPIAFLISLFFIYLLSLLFKDFAPKTTQNEEKTKTYACGEDFPSEKAIPNYEAFYPFAIFFTILHIAGLMLLTLGTVSNILIIIPLIYIFMIFLTLIILFKR